MRRITPILAALLCVLLAQGPASAGWPPNGVLFGYPAFGFRDVRMFPDSAGGVAMAYQARGGTGYVLRYARVLASGDVLYDTYLANGVGGGGPGVRGVARDPGGSVGFGYPLSSDVYLYRLLANGAFDPAYAGAGYPVAATAAQELEPSAATDGNGGSFVAWWSYSGGFSVRLERVQSNATLAPGWPANGLVLGSGFYYSPIHVLEDGAGGAFVLWVGDSSPWSAYLQRVTSSGSISPGWPAGGVSLNGGTNFLAEVLPLAPSGSDHLYAAGVDTTGRTIWVQRMEYGGGLAAGWEGGPLVVTSIPPIANVEVISDGEDGAYVAWRTPSEVRALRVLPGGSLAPGWPAGGKNVLDAAAVPAGEFHVAAGPSGGLVVVWNDLRHPSRRFVRARWLLGDGSADPSQPDSGRVVRSDAPLADPKGATSDGAGGVFVAWNEDLFNTQGVTGMWLSWLPYPIALDVGPAPHAASLHMSAPRPNPARRDVAFTVTLPDDAPARAELVDLAGRRVRAEDLHGAGQHPVRFDDVGTLPAGVYFVRVSQGNRSVSDRVAIVH